MTVTATTTPQYPAAGKAARVDFAVTGAGNYLKGYFTDAPIGSEAKTSLLKSGATRIPAFITDSNKPWQFTPDVGGVYSFQVDQYTKGATGYGGGYQDSPSGYLTETLVSTSTLTIAVGQKVTQRIGYGADTATLTLFVIGGNVRQSTFDQMGFASPLIDDAKSKKALTASLNAGVLAAVAALIDQSATSILGTLASVYNSLATAYQAHLANAVSHLNADPDNLLSSSDFNPNSPEGLKRSVAHLLTFLDRHMRNDSGGTSTSIGGTGSAIAGSGYHQNDFADWDNALLGLSAGDTRDVFVALVDAQRAYAAHLNNVVVHVVADTTNIVPLLPKLLNLHALFLAELAKQSPTAPASENPGVTALIHAAGFEVA